MPHAVTHATEEITPGLAAEYLEHNTLNRVVRWWHVADLVDEMNGDRWAENGIAGVTFDTDGAIADGQHTLWAVVRSGKTITCRVTRGVEPSARRTMNGSLRQTLGDDLSIDGVKGSARVASLLRKVMIWEKAAARNADGLGGLARWTGARFSRTEADEALPQYLEGCKEAVRACHRWAKPWQLVGNSGALEFAWWLLSVKHGNNPETVQAFFDRLAFGSQDPEDKILQRVKAKLRTKPSTAPYQVYWLAKGWNAWIAGQKLTRLDLPDGKVMTDPYPALRRAR